MAIGAEDYIDQLLVKKYAEEKVDNHDNVESMVDPEKMMGAMNDYASMYRNMMNLKQRLNIACYAINARTARYNRSPQQQYKFSVPVFSDRIIKESENKTMGKIILASSSPRRADILKKTNVEFKIILSPYIEDHTTTVFSYEFIENLAYNKAKAVVPLVEAPSIII